MSVIVDPNAPRRSYIDTVFDTMRRIAGYREVYFQLHAAKQCNGVQEVTAADIERLTDAQQRLIQEMVEFILYGTVNNQSQAPAPRIETGTQKPA